MKLTKSNSCLAKTYGPVIGKYIVYTTMVTGSGTFAPQADVAGSRASNDRVVFYSTGCGLADSVADARMIDRSDGVARNDKIASCLQKLETISRLGDNWDKNGAKAISPAVISKVRAIISVLDVQPEIFPIPEAGVQMEYDSQNGSYLEFEIYDSKTVNVYIVDQDGNEKYETIEADAGLINQMVKRFYER